MPLEYILIIHRLAGLHALEYQIVRPGRFDQFVFARCALPPSPYFHAESFEAKDAGDYLW